MDCDIKEIDYNINDKAKFFCQYLNQPVLRVKNNSRPLTIKLETVYKYVSNGKLLLRSIESIKDSESKILGYKNKKEFLEDYNLYDGNMNIPELFQLYNMGFAIGWGNYSIDQMIFNEWITIKQ